MLPYVCLSRLYAFHDLSKGFSNKVFEFHRLLSYPKVTHMGFLLVTAIAERLDSIGVPTASRSNPRYSCVEGHSDGLIAQSRSSISARQQSILRTNHLEKARIKRMPGRTDDPNAGPGQEHGVEQRIPGFWRHGTRHLDRRMRCLG